MFLLGLIWLAEDGIRDRDVTGVQTCALPIYPTVHRRGLGTYVILDLINEANVLDLPHIYLGYWIGDCRKMSYKMRFQPLEGFRGGQWVSMRDDEIATPSHSEIE